MKVKDLKDTVKWQNTDPRNVPDIRSQITTNGNVLEIGCAAGNFYNFLSNKNGYVGVDLDRDQIEKAQKNFPLGNFICGNILDSMFDDIINNCKCIVSFQVFEHITEDIQLIKRFNKNKHVIFSVPNFPYRSNFPDGHKRFFEMDGWVNRYEPYINFSEAWIIKHYHKNRQIFVFQGVIR